MEIRVPTIAEGVDEGTVVSVAVKVGDSVKEGDTLIELETSKAVAPIPATASGKISQIHVKEGDTVAVGAVLVTLDGKGSPKETVKPAPVAPKTEQAAPLPPQTTQTAAPQQGAYQYQSPTGAPPPAAPSVRKMALELGIDLTLVRGSQAGGRITTADLRNYIASLQQGAASAGAAKPQAVSIDFSKWGPVEKRKMTKLRQTIAAAMVNSWTRIPHVTQFDDIPVESVMALSKKYGDAYKAKQTRLTLTSFVIKAVANVLNEFPIFNASIDEAAHEIIFKKYHHIGIAVDTEHGLMVPVIRDADKKDLLQISVELSELALKARNRTISLEEMQGGTFTISNQGGIGGRHFTPIVNHPEVAILGLGRGYPAPVYEKTKLEKEFMMPVGLSYDHRVIDGGQAARFIVSFAEAMNLFTDEDVALEPKNKKPKKK